MAEFTADPSGQTTAPACGNGPGTAEKADWTRETWSGGRVTVYQPRQGYRYTLDPLLLCSQVSPPAHARILDLGCGCGIMPLILGHQYPDAHITGIEIQEELACIARHNTAVNQMKQVRILCTDINRLSTKDLDGPADLIVSNPPFQKLGAGRISPHSGRAVARHEILLTIDQVFTAAAALLSDRGRFCMIFPAHRFKDLALAAASSGLTLEWTCHVHQAREKPPFRVMVSAVKFPLRSREVRPPVILNRPDPSGTKAKPPLFNP